MCLDLVLRTLAVILLSDCLFPHSWITGLFVSTILEYKIVSTILDYRIVCFHSPGLQDCLFPQSWTTWSWTCVCDLLACVYTRSGPRFVVSPEWLLPESAPVLTPDIFDDLFDCTKCTLTSSCGTVRELWVWGFCILLSLPPVQQSQAILRGCVSVSPTVDAVMLGAARG